MITIHRFVRLSRVQDYLRLGWVPLPTFEGTHHGHWSVHVAWLCECNPVEPRP